METRGSLTSFDFTGLDDMDPSLLNGFSSLYDRECPFEIRFVDSLVSAGGDSKGTLEAIKAKVLLKGEEEIPESFRLELSSENDLFFQYEHIVDISSFRKMQENQKLMIEFAEYPNILIKMLNNTIKEPHSYLAVFLIDRDGKGRLDFIQNLEYKYVELLSVPFNVAPEDTIRSHITFRYNAMKSRLVLMQARLQDVSNVVKAKNPSLLLHLQKSPNTSSSKESLTNLASRTTSKSKSSIIRK